MRVIVGRCRGRKLIAPPGRNTRPILDRVKQALFDRLGARWGLPGRLPPFDVLDLFAGAGSLGIEALSRGARFCCFVESAAPALRCLRANLQTLALADSAAVVAAPVETAPIPAPPPAPADPAAARAYTLIFLDPPYPLSSPWHDSSPVARVLARLGCDIPITADALAVWRFERTLTPPFELPDRWRIDQRHDYGTMSLAFLARQPA